MTGRIGRRRPLPSQERLLSLFRYECGRLFWKHRPESDFPNSRTARMWNTQFATKRAGGPHVGGYRDVAVDQVKYLEHRIIAAMFFGDLMDMEVDHINGDRKDNRIENLRLASHKENAMNRPGKPNGLPKHVTFHRREQKYKVTIRANGQRYHFGTFATVAEADSVAQNARADLHGRFVNDKSEP